MFVPQSAHSKQYSRQLCSCLQRFCSYSCLLPRSLSTSQADGTLDPPRRRGLSFAQTRERNCSTTRIARV